jgi:hypothetical protein
VTLGTCAVWVAPTSHLLVFMPLCDPFSLSPARTCDLLIINKIWKRWPDTWDYKIICPSWEKTISLVAFKKQIALLSCYWPMCHGAESSQQSIRNWGPPSSSLQGNRFFQQTGIWKWILPQPTAWWHLCETLKQKTQLRLTQGLLTHGNCEIINLHHFKSLSLW